MHLILDLLLDLLLLGLGLLLLLFAVGTFGLTRLLLNVGELLELHYLHFLLLAFLDDGHLPALVSLLRGDLLFVTESHFHEVRTELDVADLFGVILTLLGDARNAVRVDARVDHKRLPIDESQLIELVKHLGHYLHFERARLLTEWADGHLVRRHSRLLTGPERLDAAVLTQLLDAVSRRRNVADHLTRFLTTNVVKQLVRLGHIIGLVDVLKFLLELLHFFLGLQHLLFLLLLDLVVRLEILEQVSCVALVVSANAKALQVVQVVDKVTVLVSITTLGCLSVRNLLRSHPLIGNEHLRMQFVEDLTRLLHI